MVSGWGLASKSVCVCVCVDGEAALCCTQWWQTQAAPAGRRGSPCGSLCGTVQWWWLETQRKVGVALVTLEHASVMDNKTSSLRPDHMASDTVTRTILAKMLLKSFIATVILPWGNNNCNVCNECYTRNYTNVHKIKQTLHHNDHTQCVLWTSETAFRMNWIFCYPIK